MSFSELIKNFNKIRDYMRDFYVYGFKMRNDFIQKSSRTYDNEKRRIESYMGNYIRWDYSKRGKRVFISLDSSNISSNPLYSAWKSKSFTDNDINLHFYIFDVLKNAPDNCLDITSLTDTVNLSGDFTFDPQVVRLKANEYVNEGLLKKTRIGKTDFFSLLPDFRDLFENENSLLPDAVKFFQETAAFGEIGSYILDSMNTKNDIFTFKHNFIVHTLEDGVLFIILDAMKQKRRICFMNQSTRLGNTSVIEGVPLKIFVSTQTGRRYLCIYNEKRLRFENQRLDYIKSAEMNDQCDMYDELRNKLDNILPVCWGVSFGGKRYRTETLCVKLYIDENTERHILKRLNNEGRGGDVIRLDTNTFLYTRETFDTNEMMSWIKSFTGRIISVEGTNREVIDKFYEDMKRMETMYGIVF